jgi:hypothetical protein
MNKNEVIAQAVKRAQQKAREHGLKIGGVVAHPTDELAYDLLGVEGNIATVGLPASKSPTKKEVKKNFPFDELFDPNQASKEVDSIVCVGIVR